MLRLNAAGVLRFGVYVALAVGSSAAPAVLGQREGSVRKLTDELTRLLLTDDLRLAKQILADVTTLSSMDVAPSALPRPAPASARPTPP